MSATLAAPRHLSATQIASAREFRAKATPAGRAAFRLTAWARANRRPGESVEVAAARAPAYLRAACE